ALIANVGPRVVGGRRDQLGNSVLRLVAKRTAQHFVGTSSGPHGKTPLPRTLSAWTPRPRAAFPVPWKRAGAVCPCEKSTLFGHGQPSCDQIQCCTTPIQPQFVASQGILCQIGYNFRSTAGQILRTRARAKLCALLVFENDVVY